MVAQHAHGINHRAPPCRNDNQIHIEPSSTLVRNLMMQARTALQPSQGNCPKAIVPTVSTYNFLVSNLIKKSSIVLTCPRHEACLFMSS